MLERLEGYTDDQLDDIAAENENWDPSGQGDTPADASEGMRLFIRDFEECTTEGGAAAEPTGSTEVTGSTVTTEPTGSTEVTGSTEP